MVSEFNRRGLSFEYSLYKWSKSLMGVAVALVIIVQVVSVINGCGYRFVYS